MNKKNKKEQTELSYYGLYLLNYLKENKFEQANDAAFIKGRADSAAQNDTGGEVAFPCGYIKKEGDT